MPIFVLFVSAGVSFDGAFSLWVSLNDGSGIRAHSHLARKQMLNCFNTLILQKSLETSSVKFRHFQKSKCEWFSTCSFIKEFIRFLQQIRLCYTFLHYSQPTFSCSGSAMGIFRTMCEICLALSRLCRSLWAVSKVEGTARARLAFRGLFS